jgi:hypothetical protein
VQIAQQLAVAEMTRRHVNTNMKIGILREIPNAMFCVKAIITWRSTCILKASSWPLMTLAPVIVRYPGWKNFARMYCL